ncbi:MAG: methylmalonyl Co-A mutase-associated GTPase MeaB [Candidatus Sericytochromatia bacterium]
MAEPLRGAPSVQDYVTGVLAGDRTLLARAVTLIESNAPVHQAKARSVLQALLPHTGRSLRVGITGFPGAGKSTLIEALGLLLVSLGHRVAVLAIDPSSSLSRGSILGDKTRMEQLSRSPACFIRPSPAGGTLGGVARKSRETLLLCEAAGYDVILVETVGVGQSEISVRSMVDAYLLVMLSGAGDELQGIKKGVIEMADVVLFNKAEGENRLRAQRAAREFALTLHHLAPYSSGWEVPVLLSSALEGTGIAELWQALEAFAAQQRASGAFEKQRQAQQASWFESLVQEAVLARFFAQDGRQEQFQALRAQVSAGQLVVSEAVGQLLDAPSASPSPAQ